MGLRYVHRVRINQSTNQSSSQSTNPLCGCFLPLHSTRCTTTRWNFDAWRANQSINRRVNFTVFALRSKRMHQAGSDDDDACMAASQVIEAVSTVLQSTKAVPELFPAMESHLLPMIAQVCMKWVRNVHNKEGAKIERYSMYFCVQHAHNQRGCHNGNISVFCRLYICGLGKPVARYMAV